MNASSEWSNKICMTALFRTRDVIMLDGGDFSVNVEASEAMTETATQMSNPAESRASGHT